MISGFTWRRATPDDVLSIVTVEDLSYPSPWPTAIFRAELCNDVARVFVLVQDGCDKGPVAAFTVFWVVADELHLLNIAVHPDFRGRGVAKRIMTFLDEVCEVEALCYATLEVRVTNRAAISLYERFGYRTIHVRKAYYSDAGEDAWVMAKVPGQEATADKDP